MIHQVTHSSFFVGADILNFMFLYDFFFIFPCIVDAKVYKGTYLSLLCKFILSVRLGDSEDQMFHYSQNSLI